MANKIPLESAIENYLLRRCRELGVMSVKQTGMNGMPDRLLMYGGRCWFLELKRPGKKPTDLQRAVAGKLRRRGICSMYADTKESVDAVLSALVEGRDPPADRIYGTGADAGCRSEAAP